MRVALLTGGGDCPGLNAVIYAAVRKGINHYGDEFIGFLNGWKGVLDNNFIPLTLEAVDGIQLKYTCCCRPREHWCCSFRLPLRFLRGAQGQHQLRSRERGDWQREKISFRLTELNLNDLRKVPIPVPTLAEQRRIVAELDALQAEVDALKRLQAETAAELDALLPAILDRAFKGEL